MFRWLFILIVYMEKNQLEDIARKWYFVTLITNYYITNPFFIIIQ